MRGSEGKKTRPMAWGHFFFLPYLLTSGPGGPGFCSLFLAKGFAVAEAMGEEREEARLCVPHTQAQRESNAEVSVVVHFKSTRGFRTRRWWFGRTSRVERKGTQVTHSLTSLTLLGGSTSSGQHSHIALLKMALRHFARQTAGLVTREAFAVRCMSTVKVNQVVGAPMEVFERKVRE